MKVHKTELIRSIGIYAGLGLETLTVDFDAIVPDEAVMVAIKGDNGSGKTTFMGLGMTPHLTPDFLEGSLYDAFLPGAGGRNLWWSHKGQRFFSRILINQAKATRSIKAYLMADGETPYVMDDGTESDGKGRTYTACIEEILGPQSLYYLSAYRAQGAQPLARYSKPKELMRDLLSLDDPHKLAVKAGKVASGLRSAADNLEERTNELKEKVVRVSLLGDDIEENISEAEASLYERDQAVHNRTVAQAEYDVAVTENLDNVKIQKAFDDAELKIIEYKRQAHNNLSVLENSLRGASKEQVARAARHERQAARHDKTLRALEDESKGLDKLLADEETIRQAAAEIDALDVKAAELRESGRRLNDDRSSKHALDIRLERQNSAIQKIVAKGTELGSQIKGLEERAGYVDLVTCRGEGKYSGCLALANARQAAETLPQIVELKGKMADDYRVEVKEKKELERNARKLDGVEAEYSLLMKEVGAVDDRIKALSDLAGKKPLLDDAVDRSVTIKVSIDVERVAWDIEEKENIESENQSEKTTCGIKSELEELTDGQARHLSRLIRDLDSLPKPGKDPSLALRESLSAISGFADSQTKKHERIVAQGEQMKAERSALIVEVERGQSVIDDHDELCNEVGAWSLLEKSLYGAIDLSIEAAGPAIAAASNALLFSAYGPRFTVKIITQKQNTSNPNIREVFSISVLDGDTGREDDILKKSGGESVWIGKALTDGVGIYYQDASGIQYETQFGDEVEDGLTEERKKMFYRMDRAAVEAGGYSRKYYISHDPAAWAMADHIIDLDEYKK